MRVEQKDLVEAFQGQGEAFEGFVEYLVRAVARSCGLDPIHIHWDFRTNVADGGRDLIIDVPNPRIDREFLPARRSIWSIKSGDEGVAPASLKKEILAENHPNVRAALQGGWTYVWCAVHPASIDNRDAMRTAADAVADKLNVDRHLIEFRWVNHLESEANLQPNVIPVHLPVIARRCSELLSLREWGKELELNDVWVNFGGRDDVVCRITEHLLGRNTPNVLHIAGLSGIGKTRTVFEACKREPELTGVFYIERLEHMSRDLYRYLEERDRRVYLVIDETPLPKLPALIGRLSDYSERVRVVSIGSANRQPVIIGKQIVILPEPESEKGVLEVVHAAGAGLSKDVLRSIARQSGHDLRLALLLVRSSRELPAFTGVPIVDIQDVWQRLMALYAHEIGDPHSFRKHYEVLTAGIDVGMADGFGEEVELLSQYFQHPVAHVRDAATTSEKIGLGLRTRRFFEATPQALASRLFAERVWPQIRDHLDDFFQSLPDRLARRFLERCYDCTGPIREEVMARLGEFFLKVLASGDVTVLATREVSRLFQTWAEFDPARGLAWLREGVERATPEQLRSLDGRPDGSGGWRGRRQLVWLCENLACFAEHYESCEAILFHLALEETEPSIGNNSTATWQSLFWPAPAGTDLPFDRRLRILLHRLREATSHQFPLVLKAAIGCFEPSMRLAPPLTVGGRVVPPPWQPKTWRELVVIQRDAGLQVVDAIDSLPSERRQPALHAIAEHVDVFVRLGLVNRLRALFRPNGTEESIRRRLVGELEELIASHRIRGRDEGSDHGLQALNEWLEELSSSDLAVRVRDLTAQDFWSRQIPEERDARYQHLAAELIASPETFRDLGDWLASSEARSAGSLAFCIGRLDDDGRLAAIVRDWLGENRGSDVTVSYLRGVAVRKSHLPDEWAMVLDALSGAQPELVAEATVFADVGSRGFDRLMQLVERLPTPPSRFLRALSFGDWVRVLGRDQRIRVVQTLVRLVERNDPEAVGVGLSIVIMWAHFDATAIDPALASLALKLAGRLPRDRHDRDLHAWEQVLGLLCPFYPHEVADLIVDYMTDLRVSASLADDQVVGVLVRAAGVDPSGVMDVIGTAILDRNRRAIFGIGCFHSLFEAIGLQHVATWVEHHGRDHLRWLARHFQSPRLDKEGHVLIPPLTEWLFREREADDDAFQWFLMGRHSGTVWSEDSVDPARKRQEMKPFLTHELRRVREWALYEIHEEEQQAEHFRERDEEDGRR